MMQKTLITIIIPCYNVEKYILRCLDSVARQTYTRLEVLLVDDCGTDATMSLVGNFINTYSGTISFRILHQDHNKGQSAARNAGIREAKGEYIYFLDGDDYISADCIERLYQEVEKDPAVQMVLGNYEIKGSLYLKPMSLQQRIYTSEEIIKEQMQWGIYTMPWNKLVSRQFIIANDLFFSEGIIHEDNLWSFCSAYCFDKIAVVQKKTYFYVIHPSSTERSKTRAYHQEQLFLVHLRLLTFIFTPDSHAKPSVRCNKYLRDYVTRETRNLVMEPYVRGDKALAEARYNGLCALPYDISSLVDLHKDFDTYITKNKKKYTIPDEINTMKLSVITVNYNNLQGLKRTIPSILAQTYTGYEFIVIDGGSTDGSKEYLQSCDRINYLVSEKDNGTYNAMNKAVKVAQGEYCIFMNSGDTFFSATSLEEAIFLLNGADFYTGTSIFIDGINAFPCNPPTEITFDFLAVNSLNHQATFTKTTVLKNHPYNEEHRIVSDWELLFAQWYLRQGIYEPIEPIIAIYNLEGISTLNKARDQQERIEFIQTLLSQRPEDKALTQLLEDIKSNTSYKNLFIKGSKHKPVDTDRSREKDQKRLHRKHKLQEKLSKAMKLPPLSRDLKIARNGLKYFFKDLFS